MYPITLATLDLLRQYSRIGCLKVEYYMHKKSCPIIYSKLLQHIMGQAIMDIQQVNKEAKKVKVEENMYVEGRDQRDLKFFSKTMLEGGGGVRKTLRPRIYCLSVTTSWTYCKYLRPNVSLCFILLEYVYLMVLILAGVIQKQVRT